MITLPQFTAQVAALRALPIPENHFSRDWSGNETFRGLIIEGRNSPEVRPFLDRMILPSLDTFSLDPEAVRKSLLGIETSISNPLPQGPQNPAAREVHRGMRREAPSLKLPGLKPDIHLHPEFMARLDRLLQGKGLEISISEDSPLSEVLDFAEAQFLFEQWLPHAMRLTPYEGRSPYDFSTEDLRPYFSRYERDITAIQRLAKARPAAFRQGTPEKLFDRFSKIETLLNYLFARATFFLGTYFKVKGTQVSEEDRRIFRETPRTELYDAIRSRNLPDIQPFLDESLLNLYNPLNIRAETIRDHLNRLISDDPDLVRKIVRSIHHQNHPMNNQCINWLFGLPPAEPHLKRYLETDFDWDRIRGTYGQDEQYEYNQTHYTSLRSLFHCLPLGPENTVYDLGFGYGCLMFYAAALTTAQVRGIEIVPERVEVARAAHETTRMANLKFSQGNAVESDLSDGDVFITFNSFSTETLPRIAERLREEARKRRFRLVSIGNSNFYFTAHTDWLRPQTVVYHENIRGMKAASIIFESR